MTVTTQILGTNASTKVEVEATTLAMRGTLRPDDPTGYGVYSVAGNSGLMAAGLTAASNIWAFRWGAVGYALVKRITFSAANDATAFTAGIVQFNLFNARGFTASFTGGTSLIPAANMNELRTSLATSLVTDIRIATTAALTVPSPLPGLDNDPVASLICGVPATAGSIMIPPTPFFDQRPGEHPFVLAQNEGFVIQSGGIAIAATGTWKFSVKIEWCEDGQYP